MPRIEFAWKVSRAVVEVRLEGGPFYVIEDDPKADQCCRESTGLWSRLREAKYCEAGMVVAISRHYRVYDQLGIQLRLGCSQFRLTRNLFATHY